MQYLPVSSVCSIFLCPVCAVFSVFSCVQCVRYFPVSSVFSIFLCPVCAVFSCVQCVQCFPVASVCSIVVQCVQYYPVSKQWYGCQNLGFVTCTQMLMHAIARSGCTNTVRDSARRVNAGRKVSCHTGDSNPGHCCDWRVNPMFFQLSAPILFSFNWRLRDVILTPTPRPSFSVSLKTSMYQYACRLLSVNTVLWLWPTQSMKH